MRAAVSESARRPVRMAARAMLWAAAIGGEMVLAGGRARAADVTITAGAEQTLSADLVLTGPDSLTAGAAGGARCKIHGAGHRIASTSPWTGAVSITNCDVDGLGNAQQPGIDLTGSASASVTIQGTTFSMSGQVSLVLADAMSVAFRGNTLGADTLVPVVVALSDSRPAFRASGSSTGTKVFQGNRVLASNASFQSTGGWLIGGDTPAQGNVLTGLRAGLDIEATTDMTVRGNFSHTLESSVGCPADNLGCWNQVKNLAMALGTNIVVEHNVFIGRNWIADVNDVPAEFRYNLLVDNTERGWVLVKNTAGAKIHHNVLVSTKDNQSSPQGGFVVDDDGMSGTPTTEIFNNTLDAGDVCTPAIEGAVTLHDIAVLASLRSNVFTGVRIANPGNDWIGLVRAALPDVALTDPAPVRLGYADYNLFFSPGSPVKTNYGVVVAGKKVRTAGFGLNDAPASGAPDAQLDPKLAGPIPRSFPFSDADVVMGNVTVCQILGFYRQAYAPGAGSPLIDKGDPQEGAGNDIGAIGAGVANALDQFGRYCAAPDLASLVVPAAAYTCPAIALPGSGGGAGGGGAGGGGTGGGAGAGGAGVGGAAGGGTSGATGPAENRGIACVCALDAGRPEPEGLAVIGAAAAITLLRRQRPRRRP
jgi:hypothetical protein